MMNAAKGMRFSKHRPIGNQRHPKAESQAVFSRREDPHCIGRAPGRVVGSRDLPKRRLNTNVYYRWSKEFLEAGKKRLMGDTLREATAGEVQTMKTENEALKQLVAELSLENRLLKKSLKAQE
jgi:hypothetical protein